ncbi:hypothetical protein D3C81_1140430 [compost metagenome]
MTVSLLSVERGLFSSNARYQVTIAGTEGEAPKTLVIADRLEHGPFPVSRLASGKLMPVMAQSHFALEQNDFTAPLFAAAAGKAPISGELAIHYNQKQEGVIEMAALQYAKDGESMRLSPALVNVSVSGDRKDVRIDGKLAEADLVLLDPEDGTPIRVELRDLGLEGDKKENANGFALGPSSVNVKSLRIKSESLPEVELRDTIGEELLKQGEKGLDQTLSYRVGKLVVQGQEVGSVKLDTSLRNMDEAALKSIKEAYNRVLSENRQGQEEELAPAQEEALKAEFLRMLDNSPKLALDEFSLQTAHGVAKVSFAVDLRKVDPAAKTPDEIARSVLASLQADVKVDKAVIGDIATLQGTLGQDAGSVDLAALKQQSDAMTDMFSGMALDSQWAVLDGNSLSTSLAYANDKVKFNGKDMSVQEFMAFAMASAQGLGLGDGAAAGAEEEPQQEELE